MFVEQDNNKYCCMWMPWTCFDMLNLENIENMDLDRAGEFGACPFYSTIHHCGLFDWRLRQRWGHRRQKGMRRHRQAAFSWSPGFYQLTNDVLWSQVLKTQTKWCTQICKYTKRNTFANQNTRILVEKKHVKKGFWVCWCILTRGAQMRISGWRRARQWNQ